VAGGPNYALLPAQLGPEDDRDDPTPPLRTMSKLLGAAAIHQVEYLSEPNSILRDLDPDPAIDDFASMLDTLFVAQGVIAPPFGGKKPAALHPGLHDVLPRPRQRRDAVLGLRPVDLHAPRPHHPHRLRAPAGVGAAARPGAPEHLQPASVGGRRRGL